MDQTQAKPKLSDPVEYATIKRIYFPKENSFDQKEVSDQIERARAKKKNSNNSSR